MSTGKGTLLPLIKSQFHGGLEWPQRLPLCPRASPRVCIRAGSQRQGLRGTPPPTALFFWWWWDVEPNPELPIKLKFVIWHIL